MLALSLFPPLYLALTLITLGWTLVPNSGFFPASALNLSTVISVSSCFLGRSHFAALDNIMLSNA